MPNLPMQYYSMFVWNRPPLPAALANFLAQTVCSWGVKSVMGIGVLSPTAVTALGYGDPERKQIILCPNGDEWGNSFSILDDYEYPADFDRYLPVQIHTTQDGLAGHVFDMVYVDKDWPLGEDAIPPEQIARVIKNVWKARWVCLGFCEGYSSPERIRAALEDMGYVFKEIHAELRNSETMAVSKQYLAYGENQQFA